MQQNKKTVTLTKEQYAELRAERQIRKLQDDANKRNELLNLNIEILKQAKKRKAHTTDPDSEDNSDDPNVIFSRRILDEDPFANKYHHHGLLVPPFDFSQLFKYFEESDILQECVAAMVANVVGFGYHPQFLNDDVKDKQTPEAQKEKTRMLDFLGQINEDESWTTVHKKVRKDFEVTGNSCEEVIRNRFGEISMIYHLPVTRLRITRVNLKPVTVEVPVNRDGKVVMIKVKKRFRKFAQSISIEHRHAHSSKITTISSRNPNIVHAEHRHTNLRWFKEYGDPRIMNAKTGEYLKKNEKPKRGMLIASELIWHTQPFSDLAYGLPRWIGAILDVVGRRQAGVVNFDLFQNQGLPPMAILTNGVLTPTSIDSLMQMIRGARGVDNWNKVIIIEVAQESLGLDDKGNTAKVELKNLTEFRKEDLMFDKYLTATSRTIRQSFRLPDLYIGGGSEAALTFASVKAAQTIAEQQVFIPERLEEEELVDNMLNRELDIKMWAFKLNSPQLVGGEEITKGVEQFAKAGALSTNQSIKLANRLFGTEISEFEGQPWAEFPTAIVMKLLELGRLKGLEDIADKIKEQPTVNLPLPADKLPTGSKKEEVKGEGDKE